MVQRVYRVYVRRSFLETWEVTAPTALTARRRLREFFVKKDAWPEGVPTEPSNEEQLGVSLKGWRVERVD